MHTLLSLTSYPDDLEDYPERAHLDEFLNKYALDGVELLRFGHEVPAHILQRSCGIHASFFSHWLDFWLQDQARLAQIFAHPSQCVDYYGSKDPSRLVENLNADFHFAQNVGAKYVVIHAGEVLPQECFSYNFHYKDEIVIDAVVEIVNLALNDPTLNNDFEILFENLWWAGFTMTRPDITERLLSAVNYDKAGIMLDIGHLFNTNTALRTEQEGCEYVLEILKRHGELRKAIRGLHASKSLSGEYVEQRRRLPPPAAACQHDIIGETYLHILKIDQHKPFHSSCIRALTDEICPEYFVHEFISDSNSQRDEFLAIQTAALNNYK